MFKQNKHPKQMKGGNQKMKLTLTFGLVVLLLGGTFAAAEYIKPESVKELNAPMLHRLNQRFLPYATLATLLESDSTEPYINQKVKLELEPEKQSSKTGKASYKVLITDLHTAPPTVTDASAEITEHPTTYEYALKFVSKQEIEGKFEEEIITLRAGQITIVELKVEAEKEGTYIFEVYAVSEEEKTAVKGLLIFGDENYPEPPTPAFFVGDGFALSDDEEEGALVHLAILKKDNDLSGRAKLAGRTFELEGSVSDNQVEFDLASNDGATEGSFSGEIKRYSDFLLLRGDLEIEGEAGSLTAIGQRKQVFKKVQPTATDKAVTEAINIEDVFSIGPNEETEVYIRPVQVKNKKLFGIFPTGKKVLEIEVIDEGKITTKTIDEYGSTHAGDYTISVGSLEDEKDIEVTIA